MSEEYSSLLVKIERARSCLERLVEQSRRPSSDGVALSSSFSDLSASLEELCLATEVIQEQYEDLARSRACVETEQRRYQELFDLAPDGYLATDLTGTIEKANRTASRLLRVETRFLAGKPFDLFLAPDARPAFASFLGRLRQAAPPAGAWETTLRPRGGGSIPARVTVSVRCDAAGSPAGLLWLVRDVSEERRAAEALETSEERYRDLFENANDIIYTLDLDGRFTSINRAGEAALGCDREGLLGRPFEDLLTADERESVRGLVGLPIEGARETTSFEVSLAARDGHRIPMEVKARLIRREGRPGGVEGIARDLTARRALEARLVESQKLEAIGRLAGGVAHDFNNLLTVILGEGECLQSALGAHHEAAGDARLLMDAAKRAAAITQQLLAFGRQQFLQARPIDLNALVEGLSPLLRHMVGGEVGFALDLNPGTGLTEADPAQIEQVLVNLALNARDAMPDGGLLSIRTEEREVDAALAASFNARPGSYLRLLVSDTGTGMDEQTRLRIFEPFFTTKAPGRGNGLGLATAYGIVAQHGGFVEVRSAPGAGTEFGVYLPRSGASVDAPDGQPVRPGARAAGTVLLVDDSDDVRALTARMLSARGYEVLAAGGAEEAIAICDLRSGPIHLLLTDLRMPGTSGWRLAELLTERRPEMKILYMSGYPKSEDDVGGPAALSAPLLPKPFSAAILLRRVEETLKASRPSRSH